jgi:hypothetical protein
MRENKSTTEQNTASIIPPTHTCHPLPARRSLGAKAGYPQFGFISTGY